MLLLQSHIQFDRNKNPGINTKQGLHRFFFNTKNLGYEPQKTYQIALFKKKKDRN